MSNYIPPAQIWLGNPHQLIKNAISYLQQQLCANNACGSCTTCTQLHTKQHHALLWIEPEKHYTLSLLEPVHKAISYTLDTKQQFFFVLHHAQLLTTSCQNSLLKIMEEPPDGYHFLLLATGKDALLPTIQSRCNIKQLAASDYETSHPLYRYFIGTQQDPSKLLKLLDENKPTEQETLVIVNQLYGYWLGHYKQTAQEPTSVLFKRAQCMVKVLQASISKPPMPGGSKIFWKNFFLQLQSITPL